MFGILLIAVSIFMFINVNEKPLEAKINSATGLGNSVNMSIL